MNKQQFWKIIDAGSGSDDPESALETALSDQSADELIAFQQHFDQAFDAAYRWDLWGAAYIINGGCSDDGFTDFRYGLIALGQTIYEKALADPDSLADIDVDYIPNEAFGYVASNVYEKLTGDDIPLADVECIDDEESMGDEWDFDDEEQNNKRLPKLMKKHW